MYKFTILQENETKCTYTDKKTTEENDDGSKTRNSMFRKSQQSTQIAIWRFKITSVEIECLAQNEAYPVAPTEKLLRAKKHKEGEKGECVEEIQEIRARV